VHLTKSTDARGRVTQREMVLERYGGHCMAANGFKDAGKPSASLLIFDPVYANIYWDTFVPLATQGLKDQDGVPIVVYWKTKDGKRPVTEPFLQFFKANAFDPARKTTVPISKLTDLIDGEHIGLMDGYSALRID
jgi:hypothetical protein